MSLSFPKQFVSAIRHAKLKRIGEVFVSNMDSAESTVALPLQILFERYSSEQYLKAFAVKLAVAVKRDPGLFDTDAGEKLISSTVDEVMRKRSASDFQEKMIDFAAPELFRRKDRDAFVTKSFYAVIASTWTAFEILAGDCWKLTLNLVPDLITGGAMQEAIARDEYERLGNDRSIPISLLAKYEFNTKSRLGDMLSENITFSNYDRLKRVYTHLLPKSKQLDDIPTRDLHLLAASRHVIVHRAGAVDKRFLQMAKGKMVRKGYLKANADNIEPLRVAAAASGCHLLQLVDSKLISAGRRQVGHSRPILD